MAAPVPAMASRSSSGLDNGEPHGVAVLRHGAGMAVLAAIERDVDAGDRIGRQHDKPGTAWQSVESLFHLQHW